MRCWIYSCISVRLPKLPCFESGASSASAWCPELQRTLAVPSLNRSSSSLRSEAPGMAHAMSSLTPLTEGFPAELLCAVASCVPAEDYLSLKLSCKAFAAYLPEKLSTVVDRSYLERPFRSD